MKILILITILFYSFVSYGLTIPKENIASFDIIRKNKIIGSATTNFVKTNEDLIVTTIINIDIKILFFPAYKFYQNAKETWRDGLLINFEGHTDYEDEREYFISGKIIDDKFIANGIDGKIVLDKDILPLNYFNKDILRENKVFDTQKGIIRKIKISSLGNEIITLKGEEISTEKYLLDASTNPMDKGPFPQYTLWYAANGELIKFKFLNWKDKKEIITIRNNWGE